MGAMNNHRRLLGSRPAQQGIALVFVLLMMVIAITAALFAARLTLLGDKASRNDRDRQVAFQAAELALNDAELDIMDAALALEPNSLARGCKFGNPRAAFLPDAAGCNATAERRGYCEMPLQPATGAKPMYKLIDWEEADDSRRVYVKYGEFTGRSAEFATGDGSAGSTVKPPTPAKPPKYIIVRSSPAKLQIMPQGQRQVVSIEAAYKIYALGYGVNPNTKVMLEGEVYKPVVEKSCGS